MYLRLCRLGKILHIFRYFAIILNKGDAVDTAKPRKEILIMKRTLIEKIKERVG
jgi:hypothetical protein